MSRRHRPPYSDDEEDDYDNDGLMFDGHSGEGHLERNRAQRRPMGSLHKTATEADRMNQRIRRRLTENMVEPLEPTVRRRGRPPKMYEPPAEETDAHDRDDSVSSPLLRRLKAAQTERKRFSGRGSMRPAGYDDGAVTDTGTDKPGRRKRGPALTEDETVMQREEKPVPKLSWAGRRDAAGRSRARFTDQSNEEFTAEAQGSKVAVTPQKQPKLVGGGESSIEHGKMQEDAEAVAQEDEVPLGCPHGRSYWCSECGGRAKCEHGRQRYACPDCGGKGICSHGRQTYTCKKCKGSGVCKHGRARNTCRDCGGSSRCEHSRVKSTCKDCKGSQICPHNRQRYTCADCGGKGVCDHGKVRSKCTLCGGKEICHHGRQRHFCRECGGSAFCEHRKRRTTCRICQNICKHGEDKEFCSMCMREMGRLQRREVIPKPEPEDEAVLVPKAPSPDNGGGSRRAMLIKQAQLWAASGWGAEGGQSHHEYYEAAPYRRQWRPPPIEEEDEEEDDYADPYEDDEEEDGPPPEPGFVETYFTPVPPGFISAAELAPFIKGSSNDWSHLLPQEEVTFPPGGEDSSGKGHQR